MIHEVLSIGLPFPPSVNHYYRRAGHTIHISAQGKRYRETVGALLIGESGFTSERLNMHIAVWVPDKRKRDVHNYHKGLIDALQHAGMYDDDEQIDKLTIERMGIRKGGAVIVSIEEREA